MGSVKVGFAMHYPETVGQSKGHATAALRTMQKHRVPPNPVNYTIWYTYETGGRPDLNRAVDELGAGDGEFSDEQCQELYRRYFSFESENEEIHRTSERIQDAVGQVLEYFDTARTDASEFGEAMEGVSEQLAADRDPEQLQDLVRTIVSETEQMVQRSQTLEREIDESSKEIDELREHLNEVRREAMTDPLTGLANRKAFDTRLRSSAQDAVENGTPMCLLIADIDHFKKFNDTYGHPVGDKVLRTVARALREGLKGRDTPARYGGEEFGIVLPQTRLKDALTVADQIRSGLASRQIVNRQSRESYGTVTLSVGVAQFRPEEPLSELIQRADAALYRAKHNGRNRVEPEDPEESPVSVAS